MADALAVVGTTAPAVAPRDDLDLSRRIDFARSAMESEMQMVEERCRTYLRWYSPPYRPELGVHDAWDELPLTIEDEDLTRANFPITRACVDIWTSLEAAKPPTARAEPERINPPPPSLDQYEEMRLRVVYGAFKKLEGMKANIRGATMRDWMRRDAFALKQFLATRRKNLYGFSWMKVWPDRRRRRPLTHVVRNPATVFPLWSSRDPGDIDAILVAYQKSATWANAKWNMGLPIKDGRLDLGQMSGRYRELNTRWYDSTRTMVWVEEFWWIDREYALDGSLESSTVHMAVRVFDRIVDSGDFADWEQLPFVYWENSDERDSYGWSDVASVIDINDEFNRRLSQQGDIIGMYSAPRFQLLGSLSGHDVTMPGPFELIPLQDQERIEQILTRIDLFPSQQHFSILTDLLHRVSGLPPIVWGLIANAQTSGRALTASWKATEARLAPKLMRNEQSLDRYLQIILNYGALYDWSDTPLMWVDQAGRPFNDFRWDFPPMEPRDFQEVTMNEITKRDAGLQSTLKAMRAIGDEAAEDTLEEVLAEALNIFMHPDKVQAFLLAQQAELQNQQLAASLGVQAEGPMSLPTVAQAIGEARGTASAAAAAGAPTGAAGAPLPPTQAGGPVAGNAGVQTPPGGPGGPPAGPPLPGGVPAPTLSAGTLMRQGSISNQQLQQTRY